MSQEVRQTELREKTQQLLQGPLKHVRAAALAAALLPLASVAVSPAAAQTSCPSAGICGFVFDDANNNGIRDEGELGIAGASVTLDSTYTIPTADGTGFYETGFYFFPFLGPGTYDIAVQIPPGTQPSPANVGGDETLDSDGVTDGLGNSVVEVTLSTDAPASNTDFGFVVSVAQPGTGTPGYWKNHPLAWPAGIEVGGIFYTRDEAIAWLEKVGKDKTITMFSSLVPAKLNVLIGNDATCVASTIAAADAWMATYGPVGSNVAASSYAWKIGEPLHRQMDNYNNGMLCAPHRD